MRCPFCEKDDDKVIDSRAADGGRVIRRRRECLACKKRYTTYEHVEDNPRLTVIKRDGTRVPYDREKVVGGVVKACYKRPISAEVINKLVDEVEEQIFHTYDREVESAEIGRVVAARLKYVDQVAYVRFASIYKQFRDIDDFLDEVRDLMANPPDEANQGKLF